MRNLIESRPGGSPADADVPDARKVAELRAEIEALRAERDWFAEERDAAITEQFRLMQQRDAALAEARRLAEERDRALAERDRLAQECAALRAAGQG